MTTKGKRKSYVTALLVGSALSALGASPASAREVGPAAQNLSRYCTACWRNARIQPDRWEDCTQEVLTRLVERVSPREWNGILATPENEERAEFLRAIDAVKKRTQRARRPGSLTADVADEQNNSRLEREERRETVLHLAGTNLSPRQEHVVRLTLDGWTVQQIAEELDLSAARVSDEKYKAIQRLRQLVVIPRGLRARMK